MIEPVIELVGEASDDVPEMLATGSTDVRTMYVSLTERHPEGLDAEYLAWHSLDHRPEQHRLPTLRASFRIVSTPECRKARAASDERYDTADHMMNYLFSGLDGLDAFNVLNKAMIDVGRTPYLLPLVERAVYRLDGTKAAPRIKVGADVLPWWPKRGVYVLIERGEASAADLADQPGVGGAWWGAAEPMDPPFTTRDNTGLHLSYLFLDGEPAEVGEQLRPVLEQRWSAAGVEPLLAAPFHVLHDHDWGRYVP